MSSRKLLIGIIILCGLMSSWMVQATHLRAGEITVIRTSCSGLSFKIRITAYTNTGSPVKFENGVLSFGDGTSMVTPLVESVAFGPRIGKVVYETTHVFSGPGYYKITYRESNRNANILNINNSVSTTFFLETLILIDPFIGCDNSPQLLVPPIDRGCIGKSWFHNPGAYDPDGDSLSYKFVVPKQDKNSAVFGYRDPNESEFYSKIGLDYNQANENQNGAPIFNINPITGTITWDAPGAPGEYNIAFSTIQWRKVGDVWKQIGYVTRDMQIIIEDCYNRRPEVTVPDKICAIAGDVVSFKALGNDPDLNDSLKMEAFSQVFSINPFPAKITPFPAKFVAPPRPAVLDFDWQTHCLHVKDQPYQVVFKVTDKSTKGPSLVNFKTTQIQVVGPKPVWINAVINDATRTATLQWNTYTCQNAGIIEVWRKIGSATFTPVCESPGLPQSLGYIKVASLPVSATTYTDKMLAAGAEYCYRLVAVFNLPQGGKSLASEERCAVRAADLPIITKVSVLKTDKIDQKTPINGEIRVEWLEPFQLSNADKPVKFQYFRSEGIVGKANLIPIFPGNSYNQSDTDKGLNTRDLIYNYRVQGITKDGTGPLTDTSAVASSVRLEIKASFQELKLNWLAEVPWSNRTAEHPWHRIYRGPEGATESQLTLIDSVDVTKHGFVYVDKGQYNKVPLSNSQQYCYRVLTRGTYGKNSLIPKSVLPLENYSQMVCAQPDDKKLPCKPTFSADLKGQNCDEYSGCDISIFSNTLRWNAPQEPCKLDIAYYNIYYTSTIGGEYKKMENIEGKVKETEYVDERLTSFARCYKISAVDRAGNESELSDAFCFDNCPYYELPNVFTPNGDKCNDFFSAYSTRFIGENGYTDCGSTNLTTAQQIELKKKCARFVSGVNFKVFNRWGGLVYTFKGDEKSIYIDWDGRDNAGNELPSGVYYYEAQVSFYSIDPSKTSRLLKGWVQILQ